MIKKRAFIQKLLYKYRLVIVNEDTFEENFSFRLSRLNVFVLLGIISILLIISTLLLVAFTPLKEYIPGYASTSLKQKTTRLIYEVDSLKKALDDNDKYILSIKKALTGKIPKTTISKDSLLKIYKAEYDKDTLRLTPSEKDLAFREEVEIKDRYSIFEGVGKNTGIVFFPPIKAKIIEAYNYEKKMYGIELEISNKKTPVKAVADGTVIFSDFTAYAGYTIILEHSQGFISVYKNNSYLLKKVGELVKSGEVIASLEKEPHKKESAVLYFELWNNGYPVNPTKYIDFKK
ncbi:MAG: M23 family metallopeptidase [Flavobacteriaceae bacterium]|nr:M23 family metallopeptidase [Flavobacteriaceae bacterium]